MRAADHALVEAMIADELVKTPEVDAIMARFEDDGSTRQAPVLDLRDKARQFERCYNASLALIHALIEQADARPAPVELDAPASAEPVDTWAADRVGSIDGPEFRAAVANIVRAPSARARDVLVGRLARLIDSRRVPPPLPDKETVWVAIEHRRPPITSLENVGEVLAALRRLQNRV